MRTNLPSGTPAEVQIPGSPRRGVVVAPDIMGLRPLFDDHVQRLATEQGWAVCAPEPWPDHPDVPLAERMELVRTLEDDRQVGDLVAGAELLRREAGVDRVAVLGFCMGGMYAMKAADTGAFDKVVAFYGMIRVPEQFLGPGHTEPIDHVRAEGAAEVLAIIGGRDHFTPAQDVEELRAAGATVVFYAEGEHGFVHDPSRPTHRADDAADAWRRVYEFLS